MIVDCHTHWGMCYKSRDGSNPQPWLSVPELYGVSHLVVLPHEGLLHGGRIAQDNDDVVAACAASGGRMIPFCTVNTWFGAEALAEIRRCVTELGFRGIKFHPWLQGISPSTAEMDQVCELAAELDVPILFHDGTPPYSLPSQLALLARRHPSTTIVLGHCGLLEYWREAIEAMRFADNLWGCLCSPHLAAIRQLVARCDSQRLLWGSDYGFSLADVFAYRLRMMDLLDWSEELRQTVFARNPARLLKLESA